MPKEVLKLSSKKKKNSPTPTWPNAVPATHPTWFLLFPDRQWCLPTYSFKNPKCQDFLYLPFLLRMKFISKIYIEWFFEQYSHRFATLFRSISRPCLYRPDRVEAHKKKMEIWIVFFLFLPGMTENSFRLMYSLFGFWPNRLSPFFGKCFLKDLETLF